MTELQVTCLEDAVIRVATATEPISRVVVDTYSTAFLAYNTAHGYSRVDFRHPDSAPLRELAVMLDQHCNFERTDRLYAGLYRDMIRILEPSLEVLFTKDGVLSRGRYPEPTRQAPAPGPTAAPPPGPGRSAPLARLLGGRRIAEGGGRPNAPADQSDSGPRTLVAFGDSIAYGDELDKVELGRIDHGYRIDRAYPSVMARELGFSNSLNLAEPGRSNHKILRNLCDFVTAHRHDLHRYFFAIGVTHPARKGFVLKDDVEYLFCNRHGGMPPWVLKTLCIEAFDPDALDGRLNQDLEHKFWVVSCFLKKLGCRFLTFPFWNFARSYEHFNGRQLGREAAFYATDGGVFGLKGLVVDLPQSRGHHPLTEGHAVIGRELAAIVRQRGLV